MKGSDHVQWHSQIDSPVFCLLFELLRHLDLSVRERLLIPRADDGILPLPSFSKTRMSIPIWTERERLPLVDYSDIFSHISPANAVLKPVLQVGTYVSHLSEERMSACSISRLG